MFKKIIPLLLLILIIPIVYSQEFDVVYKVVKSEIEIDEEAVYDIIINNYKDETVRFRFDFVDTQWSYSSKPNYLSGIEVSANSDETVRLSIFPKIVFSGQYPIKIIIKPEAKDIGKIIWLTVNVKSTGPYVPPNEANIDGDLEINNNNKIDPRIENILRIRLKNKNTLNIKNLTLNIESNLLNVEQQGINLNGLEERKIEFKFTLDRKAVPRKEKIILTWTAKEKEFYYEESFEIIGYESNFEQSPSTKKNFLKTVNRIIVTNPGTLEKEEKILVEISGLKRLFTSTNPGADLETIDDKSYLIYRITLAPEESVEITATTSYRIPIIILIVIVIIVIFYFKMRSSLVISKKASIAKMEEGGISEIKILLHVKNRSNFTIDEIDITDTIPHIGEMDKEIQIGTIKPVSIAKHKRIGTIVKWQIISLEKYEERIITYRIRSKLSILGGLILPAAKLKFKEKGKERVVKSSKLKLSV